MATYTTTYNDDNDYDDEFDDTSFLQDFDVDVAIANAKTTGSSVSNEQRSTPPVAKRAKISPDVAAQQQQQQQQQNVVRTLKNV